MPTSAQSEQAAMVALFRERPRRLKWAQLTDLVLDRGSAITVRDELRDESLFDNPAGDSALDAAARDIDTWSSSGLQFWTILDPEYPARVRDIVEAPPFLFARGMAAANETAVSVVGSRDASPQGLRMASSIAETLVDMQIGVIAGLAAGVDTAAHLATLAHGGRTIAVIGTGINRCYPTINRELQRRIERDGLVLSQFWPEAPPQQQNFPMRNAVMSGYGVATVVVEAGEKSGARIQARMAVHHGRPVILSDLVLRTTEWGKRLVERPDVYVAGSTQEVRDLVAHLAHRPAAVDDALDQIAI